MIENPPPAAAAFDPHAHPRRLNLGCGFDHRDGFLNVDLNGFHRPDLIADARRLSQLPSDFYDELVANDVLEHLERTETLSTLIEWSRVLRVGGTIRLQVPDLNGLASLIRDPAHQSVEEQERLVQCLFGTQNYSGDYHHTGFTEVLLRHYLQQAGFANLVVHSRDVWLFDVEATKSRTVGAAPPVRLAYEDSAYRVEWRNARAPDRVAVASRFTCSVELQNAGERAWPADQVFLSYHWLEGRRVIRWDGRRTAFPSGVSPGDEVVVAASVEAPDDAGDLTLVFTLVHEDVAWFEQKGAATLEVGVRVELPGGPLSPADR